MDPAGGINVLVVDDRPANLLVVEAALADLGVNVLKAESGAEALRLLLEHDVALVLMDVSMSMMDGFEVLRLIKTRDRSRSTPVIFATATYNLEAVEDRAYALGAVDLIGKPIKVGVLRAKVKALVELFKEKQELQRLVEELKRAANEDG